MAFLNDVVDLVKGEISHIGLGLDATTEVEGGGYVHKVPTYAAASGQSADITSTLEFDGPANEGPITHLLFKKAGALWVARTVGEPKSFNSEGRLNLTSAPVTSDFLS